MGMPRFVYWNPPRHANYPTHRAVDILTHTQTFKCNGCGTVIHFDTDWVDREGGFIGLADSRVYVKVKRSEEVAPNAIPTN